MNIKSVILKLLIIVLFTVISSCGSSSDFADNKADVNAIKKADTDFCRYAVKEGFFNAFLKYADKGIIKFSDGRFPVTGIKALSESFKGKPGPKNLIWSPEYGEVAVSGELGYTWGNWIMKTEDTTYYGNYFTVWKKQKDGSWKVKLDGGNSTPPVQD